MNELLEILFNRSFKCDYDCTFKCFFENCPCYHFCDERCERFFNCNFCVNFDCDFGNTVDVIEVQQ